MATSQVILEHLAPDSATSTDEQPSNDQPTGDQGATKDASEVSERLRALRHMYNMYQVPRPLFSGFESEVIPNSITSIKCCLPLALISLILSIRIHTQNIL
jgi:hypothetical protein